MHKNVRVFYITLQWMCLGKFLNKTAHLTVQIIPRLGIWNSQIFVFRNKQVTQYYIHYIWCMCMMHVCSFHPTAITRQLITHENIRRIFVVYMSIKVGFLYYVALLALFCMYTFHKNCTWSNCVIIIILCINYFYFGIILFFVWF